MADAQFHVLAVDDSLIDRKLIERLLKTSSYQVTAVDSGVKALDYLRLMEDENVNRDSDIPINLIITDFCMPGINGYDLLKKIKESKSLKDIPVVIMSSENIPSRINSCLKEGAQDFILKPLKQSDVSRLFMEGKIRKINNNNNNNNRTGGCNNRTGKPMEEISIMMSSSRTR